MNLLSQIEKNGASSYVMFQEMFVTNTFQNNFESAMNIISILWFGVTE